MVRGFFVTGTDTGVGKTVVSAALMHRLRLRRSGPLLEADPDRHRDDDDTATVERLGGCAPDELWRPGVRLRASRLAAPRRAARRARGSTSRPSREAARRSIGAMDRRGRGRRARARERVRAHDGSHGPARAARHRRARDRRSARSTTRCSRSRRFAAASLEVAGVIMAGPANSENRLAIERYGDVHVVGEMPPFDPLTLRRPARVGAHGAGPARDACRRSRDDGAALARGAGRRGGLASVHADEDAAGSARRSCAQKACTSTPRTDAGSSTASRRGGSTSTGTRIRDSIAALADQARELEHVIFAGCTHRPAVELAERLLADSAGRPHARVLLGQRIDRRRGRGEDGGAVLEQPRRAATAALRRAPPRVSRRHGRRDVRERRRRCSRSRSRRCSFPSSARTRRTAIAVRCRSTARRAASNACPISSRHCATSTARRRGHRRADAAGRGRHDRCGRPSFSPACAGLCDQFGVAADRRRSAHRLRPHRTHVRVRARGGRARHHLPVEGAHGRLPAAWR